LYVSVTYAYADRKSVSDPDSNLDTE